MALLQQPDWHDFGPRFACEQLAKRHCIEVSDETLRGWMIQAGLWKSRGRKMEDVHCWRARRSAFGELVQWDTTSEHDWLEGRGAVRYLVKLIDDATAPLLGQHIHCDISLIGLQQVPCSGFLLSCWWIATEMALVDGVAWRHFPGDFHPHGPSFPLFHELVLAQMPE